MILELPSFESFIAELKSKQDVRGITFWGTTPRENNMMLVNFKVILTALRGEVLLSYVCDMGSEYEHNKDNLQELAKQTDKRLLEMKKKLKTKKIELKSGRWIL